MSQQDKRSLLNPVGKVTTIKYNFPGIGEVTLGTALIDLSLAPEGSELYVQPSEDRLRLEVEVADANASGWKKALEEAHDRIRKLRGRAMHLEAELKRARKLLLNIHDSQFPSSYSDDIREFLFKGSK